MNETKIEMRDFEQDQKTAMLNQRRMIIEFKKTETWKLIENTLTQMKRNLLSEKEKIINGSGMEVKQKVLYLDGKQDCIENVFDAIDGIKAQGDAILLADKMTSQARAREEY